MPGHEPISVAGLVEKSGSERRRTDADKLPSEVHHPWIERQLTNDGHGEKVPGPAFVRSRSATESICRALRISAGVKTPLMIENP